MDLREAQRFDAIVRGLTAAAKTLRLYPETSEMRRQSVEGLAAALAPHLRDSENLTLTLDRNGFSVGGDPVGEAVPGAQDISDQLRAHGAAAVTFSRGLDAEQLMAFLTAVLSSPDETRKAGGLRVALAARAVQSIAVTEVRLTLADEAVPGDGQEDDFLAGLVGDEDRLSDWIEAGAQGDQSALAESLAELSRVAGTSGRDGLLHTLERTFARLDATAKDVLLGAGAGGAGDTTLIADLLAALSPADLAGALVEGPRGRNLLALSAAVNGLPLGERLATVLDEVQSTLRREGRSDGEMAFFDRMIKVRRSGAVEPPLAETRPIHKQVAAAAAVSPAEIGRSLEDACVTAASSDESCVQTMLALLDRQYDLDAWSRALDALVSTVPGLIDKGELRLAGRIMDEIDARAAKSDKPWPELTDRAREATAKALSPRTLPAVLKHAMKDPDTLNAARTLLTRGGDTAYKALVHTALSDGQPVALETAEQLVGRRIEDLLADVAHEVAPAHVAPLMRRLVASTQARARRAAESVIRRPDARSRQEAARGLAQGQSQAAYYLTELLGDTDPDTAILAARALGTIRTGEAAAALVDRLAHLSVDGKDFALAREVILALGLSDDARARKALGHLAKRKALLKTGHFSEVCGLARQALDAQAERRFGASSRREKKA